MINFAAICPHPAVIISEIGSRDQKLLKKTAAAMDNLAASLAKTLPDVLVVISPHGFSRYDKFTINLEEKLKGDFNDFEENELEFHFENDIEIMKKIMTEARNNKIPLEMIRETEIDYGTLVPLYFLIKKLKKATTVVPIGPTFLDLDAHFSFGKAIGKALEYEDKNVAIIASADLSHRLTDDAPAGFSIYGKKFDQTLIELLEKNELEKIVNLHPDFCQEAQECGLRSIVTTLGAISASGRKLNFKKFSYEGPLGVGHLVGKWQII